ncbi:MAG: hypothetical protein ACP6IY_11220 [Promethearchaeia archaeon]
MENERKEKIINGAITSIIFLLALTINDILVVRYIIKPLNAWSYISYYHIAIWSVMCYSIYFMCFLLSKDWRPSIYLYLLLNFHLEDTLYYYLELKPLPESLPWLWGQPTAFMLIVHNIIGVALIFIFEFLDKKYNIWQKILEKIKNPILHYILVIIVMYLFSGLLYFLFPRA